MKKFYKVVAIAALFAGFVFTGCNTNISDDSFFTPSNVSQNTASRKTITITATSETGLVKFGSSKNARTVLPEAVDGTDLDFYIGAKKKGGDYSDFEKITFTPGADNFTGSITKEYDLASYEFKLYAVPEDKEPSSNADADVKAIALFAGYAAADLRYNDLVQFYLSSTTISGKGSFEITINSNWNIPAGYTVSAEVKTLDTNTRVYPSSNPENITPASSGSPISNKVFKTSAGAEIQAGSYNLVLTVNRMDGETVKKSYVYSEKLVILPNRLSKGSVNLPDIIEYAPTQPADLIAGFVKPATTDLNYYTVEFAWTDTSYCERGFQLEILKVDTPDFILTPKTDAEWNTLKGAATASTTDWRDEFDTNLLVLKSSNLSTCQRVYNDGTGSLNMNANHVTLKMELGSRFVARICALNDVGPSAYTYLNLHKDATVGCTANTTINDGPGYASLTPQVTTTSYALNTNNADSNDIRTNMKKFDNDVTTINLYKLTYNLNGGTLYDAEETLASTALPALVSFNSQRNKSTDLTDETATTAAASETAVTIIVPDSKRAVTTPAPGTPVDKKTACTYYDTTGTLQTGKYLELKNEVDKTYWTKWTKDKVSDATADEFTTEIATDVLGYTGYQNLQLFARYRTKTTVTAPVTIEDITKYELEEEDITIQLLGGSAGSDDKTNKYINGTTLKEAETDLVGTGTILQLASSGDDVVKQILLSRSASCYGFYDNMHLTVTRNGDNVVLQDQDIPSGGTWTIDVSGYRTGKYVIAISANTRHSPNVTYRIATVFEIVQ